MNLSKMLAVIFSLSLLLTAAKAVSGEPLGKYFNTSFDKAVYMEKRAEQIMLLRGWKPGKPFDPSLRLKALKYMEKQNRLKGRLKAQILDSERPFSVIGPSPERLSAVGLSSASFNNWTALGPSPIPNASYGDDAGQGPASGRVTAIAIHPTNPNVIYIGTAQGGVWRTLDGGATWTPIFDSAESLAIGAVAIDPLNPSIVFVGTGEGNLYFDNFFGVGLYRIENADSIPILYGPFDTRIAGTGTPIGNGHAFIGTSINKIAIDPNNDNRIFVGNSLGESSDSINVAISISGGTANTSSIPDNQLGLYFCPNALSASPTFSMVKLPHFNGYQGITDILFEPGSSDHLLMGVMDMEALFHKGKKRLSGIYRTINASAASQQYPFTAPKFKTVLSLYDQRDSHLGEIVLNKNDGRLINSKLAINKTGNIVTVLAATGLTNAVKINGEDALSYGRLFKSTNGGSTFKRLSSADGFCGPGQAGIMAVAIDPNDADNIYLGGSTDHFPGEQGGWILAESIDGGSIFNPVTAGLHTDTHAITISPSNNSIVLTGNDGGIFASTDSGSTWTSLNTEGLCLTQFYSLAVHPTDPYFTIGGTQDNGTIMYGPDRSWWQIADGDGGVTAIDQNATDTANVTMYTTAPTMPLAFEVAYSTTDALSDKWYLYGAIAEDFNDIALSDTSLWNPPLVLGPGNPNAVYYGAGMLYRSENKGAYMWPASQVPIEEDKKGNIQSISAIGISSRNDGERIVGLINGSVYDTVNGSSTLTKLGSLNEYITRTIIDPGAYKTEGGYIGDNAYITTAGYMGGTSSLQSHIYKVSDILSATLRPTPWTPINGGDGANPLPDVPIDAIAVDTNDSAYPGVSILYVGTDIGVYQSVDGGANWYPFGSGLPRVAVFDMAIQQRSRVLRVATHGRGIWEIPLRPMADVLPASYVSLTPSMPFGTTGTTVTFTAQASGGDGNYEYEFFFEGPATDGQLVQETQYSTTNTWQWTPGQSDAGFCDIYVNARNAGSPAEDEAYNAILEYRVNPAQGISITVIPSTTSGVAGSPVTFTAQASGGDGNYQYSFEQKGPQTGDQWVEEGDGYSSFSSWTWTPNSGDTGQNVIGVWVKDSSSQSEAFNAIYFTVNVSPTASASIIRDN